MPEFNRRQLFHFRLHDLTREARKILSPGDREPGGEVSEPRFLRPPGASRNDAVFVADCERCGECATACPHEAIAHLGPATGRLEGTPFIDPSTAPCHWCEDMPCIAACPSGALKRDAEEPVPPIAKVVLNIDRCLNSNGVLCDTCSYRCPSGVRAIRMVGRMPVLDADRCTGCGMCVFHCEAEPSAFELEYIDETTTS